ncbi:MAG: nucleotidyltransferase domain-containing protein [Nanoarchaeota archaeon]|nr:nucleotidyltransferase domain-containing protein [Nanoarchaeota archaeon]
MFKELNTLKMFFEEPTKEFNVREVSRFLKIAPATASKELKRLAKKGLLKEKKERIYNFYSSNLDDELYKDMKVFYNIRKIKDSKLIEELNKFYLKPTVVFFGSGAFGLDTKDSDFDLLIISEKKQEFLELKKFEGKINRRIQLFLVKDVKDLKNPHLINNILNGIILQGGIKWI